MKKFYAFNALLMCLILTLSTQVKAQYAGIEQTYIILDFNDGGGNQYFPGGVNNDGASPTFGSFSLGNPVNSGLLLKGAEVKIKKCDGGDVTGASLWWRVRSASDNSGSIPFNQISLFYNSSFGVSCTFSGEGQKWDKSGENILVANGLAPGDYVLEVYWEIYASNSGSGPLFDSNFSNNFNGAFTVEPCAPGEFWNGSTCEPCPAGYYNPNTGAIACLPCEAGRFSSTLGATSCQSCPAGRFSDQSGSTECQDCPVGTANPNVGQTSCVACVAGTYSNFTGAAVCQACGSCDDMDAETNDACDPEIGCVNTPISESVPTLGQWGLIIFGLLLVCSGAVVVWNRQYRLKEVKA